MARMVSENRSDKKFGYPGQKFFSLGAEKGV